ncbi:flagellin [Rhodopseudomonas palustris]|uniref:Flagellin C-terminal domain-containing protein n=1 Tax=Rhodopseudomonas palustris (strain BisB18) TaxID=316056 RepID=Q216W9_RHOPB
MPSDITLSSATRQNLLSLQDTAELLATTQSRLSTQKKVNSALDNPVNYFAAQGLSARSADLLNLMDGIANGVQTVQAANQGITRIQGLIDAAKSAAQQALAVQNTSAGSTATGAVVAAANGKSLLATGSSGTGAAADGTHDYSGANGTAAASIFSVTDGFGNAATVTLDRNRLAQNVKDLSKVTSTEIVSQINQQLSQAGGFAAASLTTDGRLTFTSTMTGTDAALKVATLTGNTVDVGFGANVGTTVTATGIDSTDGSAKASVSGATITALGAASNFDLTSGDASISVQLGNGLTKTINLNKTADASLGVATLKAQDIATAINNQLKSDTGISGKVVATYDNVAGTVSLRTTAAGGDQKITVTSASTSTKDIGFGIGGDTTKARTAAGAGATAANGNNQRAVLAQQFNDLLTQISQTAQDARYQGMNLLYRTGSDPKENTLHLQFNEKDSSFLEIKGVKFDAMGLGITQVTGNFASNEEIKTATSQLTNAASTLRSQASTFGSNLTVVQNRQNFTKHMMNILDKGASDLTRADLNEETANQQALSLRNSLSISALSLANQSQQSILQLLRG